MSSGNALAKLDPQREKRRRVLLGTNEMPMNRWARTRTISQTKLLRHSRPLVCTELGPTDQTQKWPTRKGGRQSLTLDQGTTQITGFADQLLSVSVEQTI